MNRALLHNLIAAGVPWAAETARGLVEGEGVGEAALSALPAAAGGYGGMALGRKVFPNAQLPKAGFVASGGLGAAIAGDMAGDYISNEFFPGTPEVVYEATLPPHNADLNSTYHQELQLRNELNRVRQERRDKEKEAIMLMNSHIGM